MRQDRGTPSMRPACLACNYRDALSLAEQSGFHWCPMYPGISRAVKSNGPDIPCVAPISAHQPPLCGGQYLFHKLLVVGSKRSATIRLIARAFDTAVLPGALRQCSTTFFQPGRVALKAERDRYRDGQARSHPCHMRWAFNPTPQKLRFGPMGTGDMFRHGTAVLMPASK